MAQAKTRHEQGQSYCAAVGGFEAPTHLVCLARDWISVHFVDENHRAYLNYDFKKLESRLFLSMAVFREFEDVGSKIIGRSTTFAFSTDGSVLMIVEEKDDRTESETQADIAPNWADVPSFGEYEALCKKDRIPGSDST